MTIRISFYLALGLLAGCATPYQSLGTFTLTGGHYEASAPGAMKKITFSANGYTDAETARTYALFRCAEYAQQNKKPYFLIYDSLAAAAAGRPAEYPNVGSVGGKPQAFAFVLLLDTPESGAKTTDEVLRQLESTVKKQPTSK